MFDPTQLDQINDVVQRTGFSDKRKRNEAIRAGMENPGAFQEQNQGVIQEAQQPSEFMGAGRKLAMNQNPDQGIASLFQGNLAKHGNEWYSYGDNDYSTAQLGTKGYNLKDTGLGTYDILNKSGQSIGKSYGSVEDAINKYALAKWQPPTLTQRDGYDSSENKITQYGMYGDEYTPSRWWNSLAEAESALRAESGLGNYTKRGYWDTAGKLEDWEILGQVMNGDLRYASGFGNSYRHMPGNNKSERLSGLQTLFDSSPLIHNDKVLGYMMDLGPNANDGSQGHLAGYQSPFSISRTDPKGNTRSNYALWRDIGDPAEWAKYGKFTGQGENFFTPVENTEKLPGWTQGDTAQYSHKSSGLGGKLLGGLGALLSFTPLAPVGMMMSAAGALANNNPLGALASLFGGVMNLGASDIAGSVGGTYGGDLVGLTAPSNALSQAFGGINPALVSGAIGGLTSASKGQNPLLGALGSGLGSMANSGLRDLFDSKALGNIVGGAASTGIKSLFNQNQAIRGSEQAGRSGGLNALLNSTPSTNDAYQKTPEEQQQIKEDLQRRAIQQVQLRQQGLI